MYIREIDSEWSGLLDPASLACLDNTEFLRSCREQTITQEELHLFVAQHYFYSRNFVRYLCALIANLDSYEDRDILIENLLEESGYTDTNTIPHSEIYLNMMNKMGILRNDYYIFDSTQKMIDTMFMFCRNEDPLYGLSALCLGTEVIVPHYYSQIVTGFEGIGLDKDSLEFFLLHIERDDCYAESMKQILFKYINNDPERLSVSDRVAKTVILQRVGCLNDICFDTEKQASA